MKVKDIWELERQGCELERRSIYSSPRPRLLWPSTDDPKADCKWCAYHNHAAADLDEFLTFHPVFRQRVTWLLLVLKHA